MPASTFPDSTAASAARTFFGGNDLGFDAFPELELLQIFLGVNARRNGFRIGQCDALYGRAGQVYGRLDRSAIVTGRYNYKLIGKAALACFRQNQSLFLEIVHLGFVGGKENVGRRAFRNLAGEKAGSAEIEDDFVAGRFFVIGADLA